ncbi:helix-turn-helix domain-containing protein [Defluviimonas sp. WL0050]|uniref:Helix-turn-helix domain-containing protein n=1 Tax=Albidovulum litorale TaxID=2984134 RepID=A0ABT2ZRR7_9RHOB|nr:helix-turn-helix domain-containing protein [Defluviimonas sp. WL0050]MCV2873708.1 helix-turn-helix domain-containing protein [Defluviimonas sp. WL0050]
MLTAPTRDIHSVQQTLRVIPNGSRPVVERLSRQLSEGQHLYFESDPARFVYEVVSGVVRLTRLHKDGRRQVIAFGFPGDLVGLPNDGRHSTECDAVTQTEIVAHRCDPLVLPDGDPSFHSVIMAAALDEISMLQDHFLMLGRRLASEKVAAFLCLLLDRIGEPLGAYRLIHLPMNRSDIADYLGLTPETISRSITQFREQKIIALEDAHTMIVLDASRLRAMAEGS